MMFQEIKFPASHGMSDSEVVSRFLQLKYITDRPGYVANHAERIVGAYKRYAIRVYAEEYRDVEKARSVMARDVNKMRFASDDGKPTDLVEKFVKEHCRQPFEPELFVYLVLNKHGILVLSDILNEKFAAEYESLRMLHDEELARRLANFMYVVGSVSGQRDPETYLDKCSDDFERYCLASFMGLESAEKFYKSGFRKFMEDPFGRAGRYMFICPARIVQDAVRVMCLAMD